MNKVCFTFLLTVFIGFTNSIVCMEDRDVIDLSPIEKEIFLREVNCVGVESISNKLTQAKSPELSFSDYRGPIEINICKGMRKYTCLALEFNIRRADSEDSLFNSILDMVKENKQLGAYTTYYCDINWISVTCDFNDKRVLEKILGELRENK